ncbi:MAG TPA: hypothetical protein VEH50_07455 [Methylomirabilota bacterium]|jgi:archaellum component FlaG (FlaF/FlaG flagellin family)|nr:hypothetical protein [Methylomirabilota bacterium]
MRQFHTSLLIAAVLACALPASAQLDPTKLPAQDAHEKLMIAVSPWLDAGRYKDTFGKKNPYESGIVALDVYFKNDGDEPIKIDLSTIELIIEAPDEPKQQVEPLKPEDVADRVLLTTKNPSNSPYPHFPLGSQGGRDKKWQDLADALKAAGLTSDVLGPHTTTHGCIYFDMNHHFELLNDSELYIPDLTAMVNNRALLFFEIELAPAMKH